MTVRHERTIARRAALQVLYAAEMTEDNASQIVKTGAVQEEVEQIDQYACSLIEGVEAHRDEIDAYLDAASDNWSIARMPIVDRIVMRVATYEMLYVDVVPVSVSINEAVDLAKDFGGEDESHRFVNGVLGNIAKRLQAGDFIVVASEPAAEAEEEPEEASLPAAEAEED